MAASDKKLRLLFAALPRVLLYQTNVLQISTESKLLTITWIDLTRWERWRLCLLQWIQSVSGWMLPKCYIFDSDEDLPTWNCLHAKQCTAACQDVTAIEEDLLGLPPNINTFCISMANGQNRSMSLGFFSQFQDLEYLYIDGCFTQILPTGNIHLPNLQHMYLIVKWGMGSGCCNCHIGPHTFRNLVN